MFRQASEMEKLSLTVNGKKVSAEVQPRTHLADFLREQVLLTGTHIGCEHGVCGACTLLIDGQPARSCITFAIACEGAEVTTIEGLDEDEVMVQLRAAFSREHALQCGYCTPGMLAMARDIVRRLPDADEQRIRLELSGNLCRCTGYVGIVGAIRSVMEARKGAAAAPLPGKLGPVGSLGSASETVTADVKQAPKPIPPETYAPTKMAPGPDLPMGKPATVINQSFTVHRPRPEVWAQFGDIASTATCMPGAKLTKPPEGGHVEAEIRVKFGPIVAHFQGELDVERDDAQFRGVAHGRGRDDRQGAHVRAEVTYALAEIEGGAATRVDVTVGFTLAGPLAQFSRSGLVNDFASRLTAEFARNLEARMAGGAEAVLPAKELSAASLFFSVLWGRVKRLFSGS